jgi:cardiolipin synthase
MALVSLPFVAVPAYAVFGRSKFEGTVEAYDERKDEIDALISELRTNLEPRNVSGDRHSSYEAIRNLSGMEMTRGNSAELLINGEATFDSILAGIARAQDCVLVQFYMFHDDGLGREMQQAMIERARAGVRVYMLYDGSAARACRKATSRRCRPPASR